MGLLIMEVVSIADVFCKLLFHCIEGWGVKLGVG
jgi:hypothetical protein